MYILEWTANDLKPRRTKHSYVNTVAPLKPTYPYSMQPPATRGNTKRHTNAPVSPTISPHKQVCTVLLKFLYIL